MAKLILTSILLATALIPWWTSRESNPRRGLRKTVLAALVAFAAYLFATVVLYNRL